MTTSMYVTVEYSFQGRIATITLRRPQVHNAFNAQVIADLQKALTTLASDDHLHAVVLAGEGSSFSAGADINAMREAATFTEEQNVQDALQLAALLDMLNTFPCPVIARVHGSAFGGGVGLIAACDIALASEDARFGFSEVKLGIAPAVISPYVIRKIGENHARVLFVTGERFSAKRAQQMGLIHSVVPSEQLNDALQKALNELLTSAPQALRACKVLARTVGQMNQEDARLLTAHTIARLRVSHEGQEGLRAFLEKRKPNWITHAEQLPPK